MWHLQNWKCHKLVRMPSNKPQTYNGMGCMVVAASSTIQSCISTWNQGNSGGHIEKNRMASVTCWPNGKTMDWIAQGRDQAWHSQGGGVTVMICQPRNNIIVKSWVCSSKCLSFLIMLPNPAFVYSGGEHHLIYSSHFFLETLRKILQK